MTFNRRDAKWLVGGCCFSLLYLWLGFMLRWNMDTGETDTFLGWLLMALFSLGPVVILSLANFLPSRQEQQRSGSDQDRK